MFQAKAVYFLSVTQINTEILCTDAAAHCMFFRHPQSLIAAGARTEPELMLTHTDTQRNVCFEHESMKNILKHGIIVTLDKSTHCYIFFLSRHFTLYFIQWFPVLLHWRKCVFGLFFPPSPGGPWIQGKQLHDKLPSVCCTKLYPLV